MLLGKRRAITNGCRLGRTPGDGEGQRLGVLPSMGSQTAGHNLATEQPPQLWFTLYKMDGATKNTQLDF